MSQRFWVIRGSREERRAWDNGGMMRWCSFCLMSGLALFGLLPGAFAQEVLPSADAPVFIPYNPTGQKELDLWRLEEKRVIRSQPVVSPDRALFAYTEVIHIPGNRQTFSKLYLVPVEPLPPVPPERRPSEEGAPQAAVSPTVQTDRFQPEKTIKRRKELLGVGHDRTLDWEFRTLTVVDWSAATNRLLFKQRSGVHHVGLRTSDILVYDRNQGTVTIYPELRRILQHYWKTHGNLPQLEKLAWDIYPLGWEPGSDSAVLFKAWAYDRREKKFLGLWRYDVDSQRSELLGLQDITPALGANGLILHRDPVVVTR